MEGMKKSPNIVVLGARGMLGQTVFRLLREKFPKTVWGTDRKDKTLMRFDAKDAVRSFERIRKHIGRIEYVVNCIAQLDEKEKLPDVAKYITVNALVPHAISSLAERHAFRLIHVSTDAVFGPLTKTVTEKTPSSPVGIYALSKLLGETTSPHTLTIRTSIVGTDPFMHHGIVEWALSNKHRAIDGYANQRWTGATTIQFAELCVKMIETGSFDTLRKKSHIFHFFPLGPTTKYQLLREIKKANGDKTTVRKVNGGKITRNVTSMFKDLQPFKSFYRKNNLQQAILQMLKQ